MTWGRAALIAVLALGLPIFAAEAQPDPMRTYRVGYLSPSGTLAPLQLVDAFRQALRDLGYVEGRNLVLEYRSADGSSERLPQQAAELVRLKVDVIVTAAGTAAALTARQATGTVPIVFIAAGDPVTSGLVGSLARPGGNVTGVSLLFPELVGKGLEQLKQAVPGLTRVAVLVEPGAVPDSTYKDIMKEAERSAAALALRLHVVEALRPADLEPAFTQITKVRAEALTVLSTPMFSRERKRLVALAARNRLPTAYSFRLYVEEGGLLSYGPDLVDLNRRGAIYVDKILKGARPADLPVEQPTKFELALNLKTAKALGLTIPPPLLLRADHVID